MIRRVGARPAADRAEERGFTLVEAVVSIALLSLVTIAMISLFGVSSLTNERGGRATRAVNLAQAKVEETRGRLQADPDLPDGQWADHAGFGDDPTVSGYTYSLDVVSEAVYDTRTVSAIVYYSVGNIPQSVTVTTVVAP